MKPRKVVLTLEVVTDAPLSVLRRTGAYCGEWILAAPYNVEVKQAQANVVSPEKEQGT